jgi:hypothetical protein
MPDKFVDEALLKLAAILSEPKLLNVLFYTLIYTTDGGKEGVLREQARRPPGKLDIIRGDVTLLEQEAEQRPVIPPLAQIAVFP